MSHLLDRWRLRRRKKTSGGITSSIEQQTNLASEFDTLRAAAPVVRPVHSPSVSNDTLRSTASLTSITFERPADNPVFDTDEPTSLEFLKIPVFELPLPRNIAFVDGSGIIGRIQYALTGTARPLALVGLGGIGKTQAALEYAYSHSRDYDLVFWVRCGTFYDASTDITRLANILGLVEREAHESVVVVSALLQSWLTSTNHSWLLIFDNVDDLDFLWNQALPAGSEYDGIARKDVIITSRNLGVRNIAETLSIEPLNNDGGVELIMRLLREDQITPEMSTLVLLMGGLPLALSCVCGYLQQIQCSISDFLDVFHSHRSREWDTTTPRGYDYTFSQMFQYVLNSLSPKASDLLSLLAMFNPDQIPERLLKLGDMSKVDYFEGLTELLRTSLIRRDRRRGNLSMHRLVQFAVKHRLGDAERSHLERLATAFLFEEFPSPDVKNWVQCAELIPHVAVIMEFSNTEELRKASIARKAAKYLWYSGNSTGLALSWSRMAADLMVRNIDFQYPGSVEEAVQSQILAIEISLYMYDFSAARHLLRDVETHWPRSLNQDSKDSSRHDIQGRIWLLRATADYETGLYASAEHLLRQTIHKYALNGLETLTYVEAMRVLAMTLQATGNYHEGLQFAEQAVLMSDKLSIKSELDSGQVRATLAELYESTGRYSEAEGMLRTIITIPHLNRSQFSRLSAMSTLTTILIRQNKLNEALPLALQLLCRQENEHETSPALVMRTNDQLRTLYQRSGKLEQAEVHARRYLTLSEQYWGPDSSQTVSATLRLCSILRQRGKSNEAIGLCIAATKIDVDTHVVPRTDERQIITDIAADLRHTSEISKAADLEKYLIRCLERPSNSALSDDLVETESVGHDSGYETSSLNGDDLLKTDGLQEVSMWMCGSSRLAVLMPSLLEQYNLAQVQRRLRRSFKTLGVELLLAAHDNHEKTTAELIVHGRRSLAYLTTSSFNSQASHALQQSKQLRALAINRNAREWTINQYLGNQKDHSSNSHSRSTGRLGLAQPDLDDDDDDDESEDDSDKIKHQSPKNSRGRNSVVIRDNLRASEQSRKLISQDSDLPFFQASVPSTTEIIKMSEFDKTSGDIMEILQRFADLTEPTPSKLLEIKSFVMDGDAFVHFYQSLVTFASGRVDSTSIIEQNLQPPTVSKEKLERSGEEVCDTYNFRFQAQPSILSLSDRVKLRVQDTLGVSIVWWPLRPPQQRLRQGHLRVAWKCICGQELTMDIAESDATRRWIRDYTASQNGLVQASETPVAKTSATSLTSPSGSLLRTFSKLSSLIQNEKLKSSFYDPKKSQPGPDYIEERFVHWCVQAKRYETALNHIRVIKRLTTDSDFIRDLRSYYRQSRRWRWFVTLNECSSIKLVKFVRIDDSREIVKRICNEIPVPNTDYEIDYNHTLCPDPEVEKVRRQVFINAIEAMLIHRYHYGCEPVDEDMQRRIPKRKTILEAGFEVVGYGLHADEGFAPWRLLVVLLLTQPASFLFAWYYLSHQGAWDLQTAFVPWVMIMTSIAMLMLLPGTVAA